ncbi:MULTISPECIES: hypothetical protein [Photobacterium]|jgi:hypothetical protein|uniref:Uncharacterized protein n=1 Tax=Photobacterium carnosum TaxID=2023717 RepID=A0A2N4UPY7_9GAMM|nr:MULTISPECIES: hypothetical protein [Photobacterium]MBY3789367.1 hypothetical protein [Photobacterium carnosum]MCD9463262.1 hypothetical protein [Photobacterium phosphoreum]MCD9480746.1 hypothetical protein [Photobacterium phosphoreum]MCD9502159.1 hypothetical protein [Photobacterium phosphoreum]MCD9512334.1 hypothetical protein [Photobacterium phosphoreum]
MPTQNANPKNTFVTIGRVSDCENILMFIESNNSNEAQSKFIEHVKIEHDWNGDDDIYIDFCISLSEYVAGQVYNENYISK